MRELVKVDGHFEFVDAVEEVLEYDAHVRGTFFEGFLAVKHLASNACARFGGSAQTSFVEGGRLHHCVERFGIISLPCLVAGFDLDFTTLRAI
jgi:hypothetical protein